MNSPAPRQPESVPRIALKAMALVLFVLLLLALYANVQRWRRDKLETVIVTPAASPSPTAPAP
jgi:cell division septal protein FtsQ